MVGTEGAGGAVHILRHQFDAAQVQRLGRGRPVGRPVAGLVLLAGGEQPGEQAALAAAEVEVAAFGGNRPRRRISRKMLSEDNLPRA